MPFAYDSSLRGVIVVELRHFHTDVFFLIILVNYSFWTFDDLCGSVLVHWCILRSVLVLLALICSFRLSWGCDGRMSYFRHIAVWIHSFYVFIQVLLRLFRSLLVYLTWWSVCLCVFASALKSANPSTLRLFNLKLLLFSYSCSFDLVLNFTESLLFSSLLLSNLLCFIIHVLWSRFLWRLPDWGFPSFITFCSRISFILHLSNHFVSFIQLLF